MIILTQFAIIQWAKNHSYFDRSFLDIEQCELWRASVRGHEINNHRLITRRGWALFTAGPAINYTHARVGRPGVGGRGFFSMQYTNFGRAGHFRDFGAIKKKLIFCIFYQVILTGSGLFK